MTEPMAALTARAGAGGPRRGVVLWVYGLSLPVAAVALVAGVRLAEGAPRMQTVLPLAVAAGLVLTLLAATRFAAFTLVTLVLRPCLDAAKLSGPPPDAATGATASGTGGWMDPAAMLAVLFIMAGLVWLVAQPRTRRAPRPVGLAAGGLLVAGALSVMGSAYPAAGAADLVRITAVVVMGAVVARLVTDRPGLLGPVLAAVVASAAVPVLVAAGQYLAGAGRDVHGLTRVVGTFWHPNVLGVYSALLLVVCVALLPHVGGRTRLLVALAGAGTAWTLVASEARGALFAAAAGLLVVGLLQDRRVIYALVAAVPLLLLVPSVTSRFADLTHAHTAGGASGNSLEWRFEHWGEALALLRGNPVTGSGLSSAARILGKEVHNDYLRALVETGALGLLAYLALAAALVLTARRALRGTTGPARGAAVGFAGALAAVGVFGAADNVMTSVVVLWYLAALTGIALAVGRDPA